MRKSRFYLQMGKGTNPFFLYILPKRKRMDDGKLHPLHQFTLNKCKATTLSAGGVTYWLKRLEGYPIRLIEL